MCYDISFTVDIKELADYFPGIVSDQIQINFEPVHIIGHNYGEHPVIYRDRDGVLRLQLMEWGCIPFYVKDEEGFKKQRASMLNARSERVLDDTKSYWNKIKNRRCLIPLTGFYEHREVKGLKKKVPYYITLKNNPAFFIPGLYSVAELADKETGEVTKRFTFTMITREANSLMKQIHNSGTNKWRMPLMVSKEMADQWLESDLPEEIYRSILHYEMPAEEMNAHTVYTIRSLQERADQKKKNDHYEWEGVPPLS